MKLAPIGVPYNSSGRANGVALGARALRDAGLIERLDGAAELEDLGEVAFGAQEASRGESGLLDERGLASMLDAVREATERAYSAAALPFVYGADCPVLLGGLAAAQDQHGAVGLLFVDGHEDAWPPMRSPTGEAADSELGLALGMHREGLPETLASRVPSLDPGAVALLGPRDAAELAESGIAHLDGVAALWRDEDVRRRGPASAAREALGLIRASSPAWWLHLDLDVLSTDAFPAADYPQPGGLGWDELDRLLGAALAEPGCVGWTTVIYNPELDPGGAVAERTVEHLAQAAAALAASASRPDR